MRLECVRVGRLTMINDAYNANPASMAAALGVLGEMPACGRRVMIVGDMRELGEATERLHRQLAENIGRADVQVVMAVGEQSRLVAQTVQQISGGRIEVIAFATTDLACKRVTACLQPDDTVLIKGSRALGLEKLVEKIRAWADAEPARAKRRARMGAKTANAKNVSA
jgi:UDP-N-acetylmuramoyl-tripeptide--D-alanyl-D-alanine ligase